MNHKISNIYVSVIVATQDVENYYSLYLPSTKKFCKKLIDGRRLLTLCLKEIPSGTDCPFCL